MFEEHTRLADPLRDTHAANCEIRQWNMQHPDHALPLLEVK